MPQTYSILPCRPVLPPPLPPQTGPSLFTRKYAISLLALSCVYIFILHTHTHTHMQTRFTLTSAQRQLGSLLAVPAGFMTGAEETMPDHQLVSLTKGNRHVGKPSPCNT